MLDPTLPPFGWAYLEDAWQHSQWIHAARNSFAIGIAATSIVTIIGTFAALGLSQFDMPCRILVMGIVISPMVVPIIITAAGLHIFFSKVGLTATYSGNILSHALLGLPFVVVTVIATLARFDRNRLRAAAYLVPYPIELTVPDSL
ncbi:MAG: hypothetical protein JNJ53_08210 [Rhizobiales bacterium]|nr:hypothetical protein [Hyphomicrobiales bacterium]